MEKKIKNTKSSRRGTARLCAVQAIYSASICHHSMDKIIKDIFMIGGASLSDSISVKEMDMEFLEKLLNTADKNGILLDKTISQYLTNKWNIDRIDYVARCILRLGLTELMFFQEIPSNIIFNEYIEISKAFFSNKESGFINAVLNEASKNIRVDENQ